MLGIYSYTVILTYLSMLSACAGIVTALAGTGHPYLGCLFLLFCGLCDAFDGKVARAKPNRSKLEINFGIQIDSLSDLVAFGVLPTCIGAALIRTSPYLNGLFTGGVLSGWQVGLIKFVIYAALILFALAALIRLAYFNVTEEERQEQEGGVRKFYTGLPVTTAALIFPMVLLFNYILPFDITLVYVGVALVTGFLFLSHLKIPKAGTKGILWMVAIGAAEFFLLFLWKYFQG